jgi:hypothetical protein
MDVEAASRLCGARREQPAERTALVGEPLLGEPFVEEVELARRLDLRRVAADLAAGDKAFVAACERLNAHRRRGHV